MGKKRSLALIATMMIATLLTTSARAVDVWYDFETITPIGQLPDKLTADGAQSVGLQEMYPFTAAVLDGGLVSGSKSLRLRAYNPVAIPTPLNLGSHVTFAAKIRYVFGGVRDLFGTYGGPEATPDKIAGPPGLLRISFEPRGTQADAEGGALRFIYLKADGNVDVSAADNTILPWGIETGEMNPHAMAVTWDDGLVKLYFDGVEVGSGGSSGLGDLDLSAPGIPLAFGAAHPWRALSSGLEATTPICGDIDDVLVLRRVLSPSDIAKLALSGSAALSLTETTPGEVLYDMEGDAGPTITDKLNQMSTENTSADQHLAVRLANATPMFGSQYLRFEFFSNVAFPEATDLGSQVTLSAHLRDVPGGIRYLFTNSGGSGAAGEAIVWIDSTGTANGQAIRFLYWDAAGNLIRNVAATGPIADWSRESGDHAIHHIAVIWNDGVVSLYFDGAMVGTDGASGAGSLDLSATRRRLRFGGRTSVSGDATGDLVYAFQGDADDILVLRHVLTPAQIQTLATSGASALGLTETEAGEVLYNMETDTGSILTDKLSGLLAQDAVFNRGVEQSEAANAYISGKNPIFGSGSGVFEAYNAFPIGGALNMGTQVTLSAHVRNTSTGLRLLFSNYDAFELPGDFWLAINAAGTAGQSVWFRYVSPSGVLSITNNDALPVWSRQDGDTAIHHVAATFNDGEVKVYFDGQKVGSGGTGGMGPLDLGLWPGSDRYLRFGGHDARAFGSTRHLYPFVGEADDVMVLGRVLTEDEIYRLSILGGDGFFSGAPLPAFPDIDLDGDVDAADMTLFVVCATAPDVPYTEGCTSRDFDHDGDVDQQDFSILQLCYQGADTHVGSGCTLKPLP